MSEQTDILKYVQEKRREILENTGKNPEKIISFAYYRRADEIAATCIKKDDKNRETWTSKIDKIVLNRFAGPIILLGIIYILYELSIVQGYKLTNYTWPLLAALRNFVASILPAEGLLFDPIIRSMTLSALDGILAVLNYIPIFAILFSLVAILEDVGYIPRMTFIMDRVFRRFGLHGQSVFPLVLGGVFVGGCAIPGVMATRGIKDEKARLATILVVPLMNCLAKTPLYILLVGLFFSQQQGFAMFFIATISLIIALIVSKILSITVLKRKAPAPFILEMSPYHLPSVSGVLRRCVERLWLFIKKIVTVVIVVMILVFVLTNLPGLNQEQKALYQNKFDQITQKFYQGMGKDSPYQETLAGDKLAGLINFAADYKLAKKGASGKAGLEAVNQRFAEKNLSFYKIVNRGNYKENGKTQRDKDAAAVYKAYRILDQERKELRANLKEETIINSVMGKFGRAMEPLTKYAGFDWRVNIALLSAFAAKESTVATLGGIYQSSEGASLAENVTESNTGWTPLHALAMMLFMVVYPPCIPTLLAIRMETGSNKWMLFATIYPIILGLLIGILIFTGGNLLGLTGLQAMIAFYVLAIVILLLMALVKERKTMDLETSAGDSIGV